MIGDTSGPMLKAKNLNILVHISQKVMAMKFLQFVWVNRIPLEIMNHVKLHLCQIDGIDLMAPLTNRHAHMLGYAVAKNSLSSDSLIGMLLVFVIPPTATYI